MMHHQRETNTSPNFRPGGSRFNVPNALMACLFLFLVIVLLVSMLGTMLSLPDLRACQSYGYDQAHVILTSHGTSTTCYRVTGEGKRLEGISLKELRE